MIKICGSLESQSCLWNTFSTCLHCHQNIKVETLFVVKIFSHNKINKITIKSWSAGLYIACHQMCFHFLCYSLPTVLSRDSFNLKSRLQVWFGWENRMLAIMFYFFSYRGFMLTYPQKDVPTYVLCTDCSLKTNTQKDKQNKKNIFPNLAHQMKCFLKPLD